MAGVAQAVESLGTKVEVRKDWKAVVGQMGRAPEEVEAHPLEKLMGEKSRWQKSNPGKEGATIASQWRLNRGKSKCGYPRGTGHQHARGHDDLGKNPSG